VTAHPTPPLAYSYVRFSTAEQAKGDSLRRQTEAAARWCQRNGVRLDTSLTLHDLGKSAFLGEHRKNPDRNALAAFLKMVERGQVARGLLPVGREPRPADARARPRRRDALPLHP
jgi:DNA invertase Pin-like site-specific DNA recombinase